MIPLFVALAPVAAQPQAAAAPPTIVVEAPSAESRPRVRTPGDPYEKFNRSMFRAHERFDHRYFRPVAMGYKHIVPKFLRSAIRHFFSNMGEPVVFLNYLLQAKPGKAAETVGRFVVNSTVGLAGTIDVAKNKPIRLPHRPNGFGDTLGFYGVKPGPYLFLPFVGPTDLRDLFGGQADGVVLPLAVGKPFNRAYYQIPRGVLTGLDERAENDADLKALTDSAVDPYATLRSVYLQDRAGEIAQLKGHHVAATNPPELGEPLADPGSTQTPADSATPELQDPLADPSAPAVPAPKAAPSSNVGELQDPLTDPATSPAEKPALAADQPASAAALQDPLADPAAAAPAAPARK